MPGEMELTNEYDTHFPIKYDAQIEHSRWRQMKSNIRAQIYMFVHTEGQRSNYYITLLYFTTVSKYLLE